MSSNNPNRSANGYSHLPPISNLTPESGSGADSRSNNLLPPLTGHHSSHHHSSGSTPSSYVASSSSAGDSSDATLPLPLRPHQNSFLAPPPPLGNPVSPSLSPAPSNAPSPLHYRNSSPSPMAYNPQGAYPPSHTTSQALLQPPPPHSYPHHESSSYPSPNSFDFRKSQSSPIPHSPRSPPPSLPSDSEIHSSRSFRSPSPIPPGYSAQQLPHTSPLLAVPSFPKSPTIPYSFRQKSPLGAQSDLSLPSISAHQPHPSVSSSVDKSPQAPLPPTLQITSPPPPHASDASSRYKSSSSSNLLVPPASSVHSPLSPHSSPRHSHRGYNHDYLTPEPNYPPVGPLVSPSTPGNDSKAEVQAPLSPQPTSSQQENSSNAQAASSPMTLSPNTAANPPAKRPFRQRRKDPSCDSCRERKVKCNATETSACSECINRQLKCQFTKDTNRRMSSTKQVKDMERNISKLLSYLDEYQTILRDAKVPIPQHLSQVDTSDAAAAALSSNEVTHPHTPNPDSSFDSVPEGGHGSVSPFTHHGLQHSSRVLPFGQHKSSPPGTSQDPNPGNTSGQFLQVNAPSWSRRNSDAEVSSTASSPYLRPYDDRSTQSSRSTSVSGPAFYQPGPPSSLHASDDPNLFIIPPRVVAPSVPSGYTGKVMLIPGISPGNGMAQPIPYTTRATSGENFDKVLKFMRKYNKNAFPPPPGYSFKHTMISVLNANGIPGETHKKSYVDFSKSQSLSTVQAIQELDDIDFSKLYKYVPSHATIQVYIRNYYDTIQIWLPSTIWDRLLTRINALNWEKKTPDGEQYCTEVPTETWAAAFFAVLALGVRDNIDPDISIAKQGAEFINIAQKLMPLASSSQPLLGYDWVSSALLIHIFYMETGKRGLGDIWLSQAIQVAYRIGLPVGLTAADQHLWWSLFTSDRTTAMILGRDVLIQERYLPSSYLIQPGFRPSSFFHVPLVADHDTGLLNTLVHVIRMIDVTSRTLASQVTLSKQTLDTFNSYFETFWTLLPPDMLDSTLDKPLDHKGFLLVLCVKYAQHYLMRTNFAPSVPRAQFMRSAESCYDGAKTVNEFLSRALKFHAEALPKNAQDSDDKILEGARRSLARVLNEYTAMYFWQCAVVCFAFGDCDTALSLVRVLQAAAEARRSLDRLGLFVDGFVRLLIREFQRCALPNAAGKVVEFNPLEDSTVIAIMSTDLQSVGHHVWIFPTPESGVPCGGDLHEEYVAADVTARRHGSFGPAGYRQKDGGEKLKIPTVVIDPGSPVVAARNPAGAENIPRLLTDDLNGGNNSSRNQDHGRRGGSCSNGRIHRRSSPRFAQAQKDDNVGDADDEEDEDDKRGPEEESEQWHDWAGLVDRIEILRSELKKRRSRVAAAAAPNTSSLAVPTETAPKMERPGLSLPSLVIPPSTSSSSVLSPMSVSGSNGNGNSLLSPLSCLNPTVQGRSRGGSGDFEPSPGSSPAISPISRTGLLPFQTAPAPTAGADEEQDKSRRTGGIGGAGVTVATLLESDPLLHSTASSLPAPPRTQDLRQRPPPLPPPSSGTEYPQQYHSSRLPESAHFVGSKRKYDDADLQMPTITVTHSTPNANTPVHRPSTPSDGPGTPTRAGAASQKTGRDDAAAKSTAAGRPGPDSSNLNTPAEPKTEADMTTSSRMSLSRIM